MFNGRLALIRKDTNWDMATNISPGVWSSKMPNNNSYNATGTIDFGYFQRTSASIKYLHFSIGGGGMLSQGQTMGVRLFQRTPETLIIQKNLYSLLWGEALGDPRRTRSISLMDAPLNEDLFIRIYDENSSTDVWSFIIFQPMGALFS